MIDYEELIDSIKIKASEKQKYQTEFKEKEETLAVSIKTFVRREKLLALYQETANEIQNTLKCYIDDMNQAVLDATFPGFDFELDFTIKNDTTHAAIYTVNNGHRQKPMKSNGGGMVNMIAMASQMAAQRLTDTRDTIWADQPFRDLDRIREPLAMEILGKLCKEIKLQYIMVSHVDAQIDASDKVFEVSLVSYKKGGYKHSVVSEVRG